MSLITQTLNSKKSFVGYLTAGDGGFDHSLKSMLALIEGGVDILEIGVPFSDPVADGPTIQAASQRAIDEGITLKHVFSMIKSIRKQSEIPIILFSYFNPIVAFGHDFYQDAKTAGVDGCLVVDLPIEEADEHITFCKQSNIDPVFLISPSTSLERIKQINQVGSGMLYYVCRNGTTGVKNSLPAELTERLAIIKANTTLPVVTGFGVSDQAMASEILKHCEGFVVGSLLVDTAHKNQDPRAITQLAESINPSC